MSEYHIPVLLNESIDALNIHASGIYVDVTYGGGGHSAAILEKINKGKLYAFDQDDDAANNLPENSRFFFIQGNFRYLKNYLKYYGVTKIDGLLADLGVSSHHFDASERGFSYRSDALLDMRMNKKGLLTAEKIINEYDTEQLAKLFLEYGELFQARKLAAMIVKYRQNNKISTTQQLIDSIEPMIPRQTENQFLSKVFQAIRIEVNQELESLREMLRSSLEMLNPKGRLVVISYHSLEDRLVKNFMRWGHFDEEPVKDVYGNVHTPFSVIARKPIMAGENEILNNPRSRSARLRIAEKKAS